MEQNLPPKYLVLSDDVKFISKNIKKIFRYTCSLRIHKCKLLNNVHECDYQLPLTNLRG